MITSESKVKVSLSPKQVRPVEDKMSDAALQALGIGVGAMDALPAMITAANTGTPVQVLQTWLPKAIYIATSARKADDLLGRNIIGRWEDEEIVRKVVERLAQARPYGDTTNVPLADHNVNFETRSVVRLEMGYESTMLASARSSAMQIDSDSEDRTAVAESLAIGLNDIAFYGYNNGSNNTYGLFNDPNLPNYVTVPAGAAGTTTWATKTFLEITKDIISMISAVPAVQANLVDPKADDFTLVVPPQAEIYLSTPSSEYGKTVIGWLSENYPKCSVKTAKQMAGANGGSDVAYLYFERMNGDKVVNQDVQATFFFVGFEKKAKGRVEDYSAATSGFFLAQPTGLVRFSGI